jgi:hypothetical protein
MVKHDMGGLVRNLKILTYTDMKKKYSYQTKTVPKSKSEYVIYCFIISYANKVLFKVGTEL